MGHFPWLCWITRGYQISSTKKTCLKPPILRIPMISLAKTEWVMAGEEAHDCQEKKVLEAMRHDVVKLLLHITCSTLSSGKTYKHTSEERCPFTDHLPTRIWPFSTTMFNYQKAIPLSQAQKVHRYSPEYLGSSSFFWPRVAVEGFREKITSLNHYEPLITVHNHHKPLLTDHYSPLLITVTII